MSAQIIDGRAVAQRARDDVAGEVARFVEATGAAPGLATVMVGDDPASAVYVAGKQRACAEVGMVAFDHRLDAAAPSEMVAALLRELNEDPAVSGILLQLPLPSQLDAGALTTIIAPGDRKSVV